jgi:hypothetical protein
MKPLCISLCRILKNRRDVRLSHVPASRVCHTTNWIGQCDFGDAIYREHMTVKLAVCESFSCRSRHRAVSEISRKSFKDYWIIRSWGGKYVWELKEVLSNSYCNMWWVIYITYYRYYMTKCKVVACHASGFGFHLTCMYYLLKYYKILRCDSSYTTITKYVVLKA